MVTDSRPRKVKCKPITGQVSSNLILHHIKQPRLRCRCKWRQNTRLVKSLCKNQLSHHYKTRWTGRLSLSSAFTFWMLQTHLYPCISQKLAAGLYITHPAGDWKSFFKRIWPLPWKTGTKTNNNEKAFQKKQSKQEEEIVKVLLRPFEI